MSCSAIPVSSGCREVRSAVGEEPVVALIHSDTSGASNFLALATTTTTKGGPPDGC